jgi:Na+/H+ antiporter NhaD/arsenite permease-like protein
MVVLAANAGGAWSPIGDVTTIMLWIDGQVTTVPIIANVIFPSLVCMIVPLILLSSTMKGNVDRPELKEEAIEYTTPKEQRLFLIAGVLGLLFVPVFKNVTHLPPYMGMLFSLGVICVMGEIVHRNNPEEIKNKLKITSVLRKIDVPTVLFFLGILSAVAALQSAGQLNILAKFLDENMGNVYLIDLSIGLLSAIVDNVPLVAGAMKMYPVANDAVCLAAANPEYMANFVQNGIFWSFLAYTAGTGGSILIIGSAAGVAAMGLEKIDFIWYMKRISLLALLGYLAGAGAYWLQMQILGL